MRQRRVRTPNRATAINKPIQRPDTYQRLPEDVQLNSCEQQPVHTYGLTAGTLTVFFHTNRHRKDRPQYAGSRSTRIMPMSCDTFELVRAARRCAEAAWPKGQAAKFGFTKAGV